MVLRWKNLNILGVHWKIWLLGEGGGSWWKTYIEGGLPQKGACTVFWFKEGAWQERRGMFVRGFDPLMDTMIQKIKFLKLNYIHLGSRRACYLTNWYLTFCLFFYLTDSEVSYSTMVTWVRKKTRCGPIRIWEIIDTRLLDKLYAK